MFNLLIFFAMGFFSCFAIASVLWMAWSEDYESQIRQWRKSALAEKSNADWWQNQYSKDAK